MKKITNYHAKLYAEEITKRSPGSSIDKFTRSLYDAKVDLNPHQIEGSLFAFRSPFSKGAILADEVGLGKTIEAGIVLSQKWAEQKRKILIILPSNLRKQWSQELMDKFYIPSIILEGQSFNKMAKIGVINPFEQNKIVLCSYHFARSKEALIKAINWDLVIVDEAHRLRNVYRTDNKIAKAIKRAIDHAPKLLLTATPLQNSLMELYGLVSIIDDHVFGDQKSFKQQFVRLEDGGDAFYDLKQRISPICHRTLRRQVVEYVPYTKRIAITEEFEPTQDEFALYDLVSEYLRKPNLYALPTAQRHLITLILRKLLASSSFAITRTLKGLANKLNKLLKESAFEDDLPEEIEADFEIYTELKDEWGDEENQEVPKVLTAEDMHLIEQERDELLEFYELANSIQHNAKADALLVALEKAFEQNEKNGGQRKAIIFTESVRTQIYLSDFLQKNGYRGKLVLFNGSNNDKPSKEIYQQWTQKFKDTDRVTGSKTADMRAAIVDYFRDEAEIMIATEAAAEGINLQFCSLLVNYDLPWNPQRIEQRIGRCHRYGQKHDVVVVNFLNQKNEADKRVYELLSLKFQLFDGVFGASDEVLGAIGSGVDFEKRISEILTKCRNPKEITAAFDELRQDLTTQIDEKMLSTRNKLLEHFDEEVHEKLKVNLSESKKNLDRSKKYLWEVTKSVLAEYANFDESEHVFDLHTMPSGVNADLGQYSLHNNPPNAHKYRFGHELAQGVLTKAKSENTPTVKLIFDYASTSTKVSILEDIRGESGWMIVQKVSIDSLESEDEIIVTMIDEQGQVLSDEHAKRIFHLAASVQSTNQNVPSDLSVKQKEKVKVYLEKVESRNVNFFDQELEKMDKWAEDVKKSLEYKLQQLEKDLKTRKTEARKITKLEAKVKAQREIKSLEKRRNELRMNLYAEQDKVDQQKEKLLGDIEARMQHNVTVQDLFIINWELR